MVKKSKNLNLYLTLLNLYIKLPNNLTCDRFYIEKIERVKNSKFLYIKECDARGGGVKLYVRRMNK